jgi:hypothetical protein
LHTFPFIFSFNLSWLCKIKFIMSDSKITYIHQVLGRQPVTEYLPIWASAIYQDSKPLIKHVTCHNISNKRTNFEHRPKPVIFNVSLTGCMPEVHLFVGKQCRIFHQTTKTNFYSQSMFPLPTYLNSLSYSSYFWHPINFNWRVRPAGRLVN